MSDRFQIIGHRGAMGHAPENTLASVRAAIALGADGVEVDVRWAGGYPVVFHDATLERTTDGIGCITDYSLEGLRAFDAGGGERIPTVDEVIEEVSGRGFVNFELKTPGTAVPVGEALRSRMRTGKWGSGHFLVSSFHDEFLDAIAGEDIRLGCLFRSGGWAHCRSAALRLGAFSVHPEASGVTPGMVEEAQAHGWKVYPFTVNEVSDGWRLREMGVDGVFTDYPERMVEIRDGRVAEESK